MIVLEDYAIAGDAINIWGSISMVSVATEMVRPQSIDIYI
jgi:hypothetical protein